MSELDQQLAQVNRQMAQQADDAALFLKRGIILAEAGMTEAALADYEAAIRLNPHMDQAYNERAKLYSLSGRHELAAAEFTKLLKPSLSFEERYYNRAQAFFAAGNKERALQDLNKALELNPDYAEAIQALAELKGGTSQASTSPDEQVASAESNTKSPAYRTYVEAEQAYDRGDFDKAYELYEQVIATDPTMAGAYNGRGLIRSEQKEEHEAALEDFNKALELNPKYDDAYCNRANAYLALGNEGEAVKDLENTIKVNPDYADAYAIIGELFAKKGDKNSFFEYLETALSKGYDMRPYLDQPPYTDYKFTIKFQKLAERHGIKV